jgi:flagellar hook-basal body complex protein FliE
MSIPAIGPVTAGIPPISAPAVDALGSGAGASGSAMSGTGVDFASQLGKGLEWLQGTQTKADNLAVQAATGSLTDVHDYMIASAQASLATELTVAVRNKAVEAFNEIMRMQA